MTDQMKLKKNQGANKINYNGLNVNMSNVNRSRSSLAEYNISYRNIDCERETHTV